MREIRIVLKDVEEKQALPYLKDPGCHPGPTDVNDK